MNRDGTKRLLRLSIIGAIVCIVLGYTYLKTKDLLRGPEIILTYPENGSVVASSSVIVRGQALRMKEITLNNRPITIDVTGMFAETVLLFPGYNVITITAKDKFKRTTDYKLELISQK